MSTGDPICRTCGHYLSLVRTCEYSPCPHNTSAMGKRLSDAPRDDISEKVRLAMMASHRPEEHIRRMENEVIGRLQAAEYRAITAENGLAEMKRMEYLMSKAPCLARLDELAAYAAKDDER